MNCKNCHTDLLEQDDYCKSCGGKVVRKRLTLKHLFEHLSETFFNYDNKLLRTITTLFKQPTVVIDNYISGVRKRYVNPISFFGLALTISGLSTFIIRKFYLEEITIKVGGSANKVQEIIQAFILDYNSLIYSILIPFLAIISYITFRNKKYNYTEHIVLFFYTMSLFSLVSVFISQVTLLINPNYYNITNAILSLFLFIYHCLLFKRLFNLSIKQLILKILLFLVLFFILYILLSMALSFFILFTGKMTLSDFKPIK